MKHIHHDLIVQWVADTTQVVENRYEGKWKVDYDPIWHPIVQYRIRHKHQDLIDQKAARPELIVEYKGESGAWHICPRSTLKLGCHEEYRLVEPEHKHQDLIDRKKERPELIVEFKSMNGTWFEVKHDIGKWHEISEYRLVEPSSVTEALLDACMVAHIGFNEGDPRKTIHNLITWHVQVALDPLVLGVATAAHAGWKLMPLEPTPAMREAAARADDEGFEAGRSHGASGIEIYAAMLAAAPTKEST